MRAEDSISGAGWEAWGPDGVSGDAVRARAVTFIRRLIWAYFWLLLLEGVLRKWVVPGLSAPLLVIRDPLVILAYLTAWCYGLFPRHPVVTCCLVLAVAAAAVDLTRASYGAQFSPLVMLYGLRSNFLHIPLCFLMPLVLGGDDLARFGKRTLLTAIPCVLLMVLQSRTAPESLLNCLAGQSQEHQLEVVEGMVRPTSVFTAPAGVALYLGFLAAFAIHAQLDAGWRRPLPWLALACVVVGLGVAGSRGALGCVGVVLAVAPALLLVQRRAPVMRTAGVLCVLVGAVLAVTLSGLFEVQLTAFQERIGKAAHDESGYEPGTERHETGPLMILVVRTLNEMLLPLGQAAQVPPLGLGLGTRTTAGAQWMAYGSQPGVLIVSPDFRIGSILRESEWARHLLECGTVMGLALIAARVAGTLWLFWLALRAAQQGASLPLLLFGLVGPLWLKGTLSQPTSLGFLVMGTGLLLTACKGSAPSTGQGVYADDGR